MPKQKPPYMAYILDALCDVPKLTCRAMFGGYGLYSDAVFFALVWDDQVYFRVDEASEKKYIAKGARPFLFRDGFKLLAIKKPAIAGGLYSPEAGFEPATK